jgi:hypothetical protein
MRCALASSNENVKTAGTKVFSSDSFCGKGGGGGGMNASDAGGATALSSEDFVFLARGVFLAVEGSSAAFRLLDLPTADGDNAVVVLLLPPTGVDATDRVADRVTGMINLSVENASLENANLMHTIARATKFKPVR